MIPIGWISLIRLDSWKIYKAENLKLLSDYRNRQMVLINRGYLPSFVNRNIILVHR